MMSHDIITLSLINSDNTGGMSRRCSKATRALNEFT